MKLHELTGRAPLLPLSLELENGQTLVIEQWLRVLPEQRYVGKAQWQGRTVLAKVLIGNKASRQYQRELAGAQLLTEQGITSADLLDFQQQSDGSAYLLFEFIDNAQSLAAAWQECKSDTPLSERQTLVLGGALSADRKSVV